MTRHRPTLVIAACLLVGAAIGGCSESARISRGVAVPFGDAETGRTAIESYGCGSCHEIPGVAGANGDVGPPLTRFGRRSFIAGELANTPDNLVQWVMNPKDVEPKTAMPDLDVSLQDAQNIAAYLERLN